MEEQTVLLCALAGFLTGITFIYKDLCFLNLFTLIPLIYGLKNNKHNFLKGMIYAVCLNGVSMAFLFSMHPLEFMGLTGVKSYALVFLMYFGILLVEAFWGGLFIYLYKRFFKNILLFPLVYVIYEIVISTGYLGLTFSHLYLPWYKHLCFIQSASLFSSYFLTFIIVFINVLIFKFYESKNLKYGVLAIGLFAVNIVFGVVRLNVYTPEPFKYDIALIQGNLSSSEKWENNSIYSAFKVHNELSLDAKEKYDVKGVVWAETVINTELDKEKYWYKRLSDFSKDNSLDLFSGCFYSNKDYYHNSMIAFDKNGEEYNGAYHKRHLIPFAEKESFKKVGLVEGDDATVINTALGKMGGIICIDSAYPHLTYHTKYNGAEYLMLITNDSWFKDSFGVENHFAHSVFRAVETNSFLLRTGNTGITAVVSPKGEVKGRLEPLEKGYIVIKGGEVYIEKK